MNSTTQPKVISTGISGEESIWRREFREAIRDPLELCRQLQLPIELSDAMRQAEVGFPLFVPQPFLQRIRSGDLQDPLLLQVLPRREESVRQASESDDAVGDLDSLLEYGLMQKYSGRALYVTTGVCPVHCRYCFRKHFPYPSSVSPRHWEKQVAFFRANPNVDEVILSGGDPLSLTDSAMRELIDGYQSIESLKRLRIHTRFPIMIPNRVTSELIEILSGCRLSCVVVLHINHANEIGSDVVAAIARLRASRALLLNQSVLLKGINDEWKILSELCLRLIDVGVLPYYLHQLDRTTGTSHFEVPISEGNRIMGELRRHLPGYAIPRYVMEEAGKQHKTPLEWTLSDIEHDAIHGIG